jgi:hypothetical protein
VREEHVLRVFENRVLRRIFKLKRHEMMGGWRKLHNEGLRDLHSSSSIIRMLKLRRMKWVGHIVQMGDKRKAFRLLLEKPEEKRPLRRLGHRWVNCNVI